MAQFSYIYIYSIPPIERKKTNPFFELPGWPNVPDISTVQRIQTPGTSHAKPFFYFGSMFVWGLDYLITFDY